MNWKHHLTQTTHAFNPAAVQKFTTLAVPEHFSVVAHIPQEITVRLADFAASLKALEPSLLLVEPSRYHVTLFTAPATTELATLQATVTSVLRQPLQFEIWGTFLHPLVIAIVVLPSLHNELFGLRQSIAAALSLPAPKKGERRDELGWISLARFSQSPSPAMVRAAQQQAEENWGVIKITHADIYQSRDKHLATATPVAHITTNG